jgi:hypothetical protein
VPNARNGNAAIIHLLNENAVVAAAEAKAFHGRPEFLYIAATRGKEAVDAVEDFESGRAIDGSEIGLSIKRPSDGQARRRRRLTHLPNSRRISS